MSAENLPAVETTDKAVPPYVPFKTFINFIERLGAIGVPNRVDRTAVAHMSGSAQAQLLAALRYFKLISDGGLPHENLRRFAKANEMDRKKAMLGLLQLYYKDLFSDDFDFANATTGQLTEYFSERGASGDTLRKCIAFLLAAAKFAGLETSKHLRGTIRAATMKKRSERNGKKRDAVPERERETLAATDIHKTVDQLILEKYPSFNPEWDAEVQKAWFEGIKQLRSNLKEEA